VELPTILSLAVTRRRMLRRRDECGVGFVFKRGDVDGVPGYVARLAE